MSAIIIFHVTRNQEDTKTTGIKLFARNEDTIRKMIQEMALLYLRNLANFLFGEYQFDSRFYNLAEHTARVYPETIQIVKNEPENWAMALFNYHN